MPAISPQMPEGMAEKKDRAKLTAPNAKAMAPTIVFGLMTISAPSLAASRLMVGGATVEDTVVGEVMTAGTAGRHENRD